MPTNTQHTPGPWQATQFLDCAQQFKVSDTSGFLIANVGIQHLHARENENRANADLIAAAPELLAELREVSAQFDALLTAHGKAFGWGFLTTQKARELIARIDGKPTEATPSLKTEIVPCEVNNTYKQHTIIGLTVSQIQERIGFAPNQPDDPAKVKFSWGFKVNGQTCAVWDYKGSSDRNCFSAFGNVDALRLVFGGAVRNHLGN